MITTMNPKLLGNPLVAWRDDRTLQIGWGRHGLVVKDAPACLPDWLMAVDGTSTPAQLSEVAVRLGLPADEAQALLCQLGKAGLLESNFPLAVTIAGPSYVRDPLSVALRQAGVDVRRGASTVVFPQGQLPSLVAAPAAARLIPVWFTAGAVHVGPVIDAGAGPCPRCVDLGWTDHDGCWPQLLAQSTSVGLWARPAQIVQAAGAIALMGPASDAVGLEMILDESNAGPGWRVWTVHERCRNHGQT